MLQNKKKRSRSTNQQQSSSNKKIKSSSSSSSGGTYNDVVNDLNQLLDKKRVNIGTNTATNTSPTTTTTTTTITNNNNKSKDHKNNQNNGKKKSTNKQQEKTKKKSKHTTATQEIETKKQQQHSLPSTLHESLSSEISSNHPYIHPSLFDHITSGKSIQILNDNNGDDNNNDNNNNHFNHISLSGIEDSHIFTLLLSCVHNIVKSKFQPSVHGTGIIVILPNDFSVQYWYHLFLKYFSPNDNDDEEEHGGGKDNNKSHGGEKKKENDSSFENYLKSTVIGPFSASATTATSIVLINGEKLSVVEKALAKLNLKNLRCCISTIPIHNTNHNVIGSSLSLCYENLLTRLNQVNTLKKQFILLNQVTQFDQSQLPFLSNFTKLNLLRLTEVHTTTTATTTNQTIKYEHVQIPYNDKLYNFYTLLNNLSVQNKFKLVVLFHCENVMNLVYYLFNRLYKSTSTGNESDNNSHFKQPYLFFKSSDIEQVPENYDQWYYSKQSSVLFATEQSISAVPLSEVILDAVVLYDYTVVTRVDTSIHSKRIITILDSSIPNDASSNNQNVSTKRNKNNSSLVVLVNKSLNERLLTQLASKDRTEKYLTSDSNNHSSTLLAMQSCVNKSQLIRKCIQLNLDQLDKKKKQKNVIASGLLNEHFKTLVLELIASYGLNRQQTATSQKKSKTADGSPPPFNARTLPLKELLKQFCVYENISSGYYDYMELMSKKIEQIVLDEYNKNKAQQKNQEDL